MSGSQNKIELLFLMAYFQEMKYLSNAFFFLITVQSHELEDYYVFVMAAGCSKTR